MFSWGAGWDINGYVPPGLWQSAPGCIHVHGSKGALRIFHYANALFLTDKDGTRQIGLEGRPAPGHFAAQVESCARSIQDGAPVEVPGEAGLAALEVLEAAYRSFEEKRMVTVR
jgi:predicted dehydrogenase